MMATVNSEARNMTDPPFQTCRDQTHATGVARIRPRPESGQSNSQDLRVLRRSDDMSGGSRQIRSRWRLVGRRASRPGPSRFLPQDFRNLPVCRPRSPCTPACQSDRVRTGSSGPIGCPVPGCRTGGGGSGSSAMILYPAWGMASSDRTYLIDSCIDHFPFRHVGQSKPVL